MRIATVSFPFDIVTVKQRLAQIKNYIKAAGREKAEMLVLPEYLAYQRTVEGIKAQDCGKNFNEWTEPVPGGPYYELMATAAKKHKMTIIYGTNEKKDDAHYYNSAAVIGPDGELLGCHRKAILNANESEDPDVVQGESLDPIETPLGKAAFFNCYEIYFSEIASVYENADADFFVYLHADNDPWTESVARMRSFDAYMPLVCSCYQKCGPAYVLNARGESIASKTVPDADGLIIVDADLRERPRGRYFWDDDRQIDLRLMRRYQRRPELLKPLLKKQKVKHPLAQEKEGKKS